MDYKFTQTWFINSEIQQFLQFIFSKIQLFADKNKRYKILEIGCFEGLSSVYFAENLLDNEVSSLTCVDPFLTIDNNDHSKYLQNNQESNFDYNISKCKNSDKICVHKITSDIFFKTNTDTFNFIYIDGCHEPDYITRDMENSFACLEVNGIMWMDDYRQTDETKKAMDSFLAKYNSQYEIIHVGYQLAIKKCMSGTHV
jgi:predicted O-methyltransferase YrrM